MRPLKIAVAGTHSTGKSTFVQALKARLQQDDRVVVDVHDSAVDARDLGFKILADHTFESTAWMIAQAIRLETQASLTAEVIIVDRPVPDALGYLLAALRHQERTLEPGCYERLEAICRAWVGEYDMVFVTELDASVPIGPGRPADQIFRERTAAAVTEIVREMVPNPIVLPFGGTDRAIDLCVERLASHVAG